MAEKSDQRLALVEQSLKETFNVRLAAQVERQLRSRVQSIIPHAFFSAASAECREMFVAGHYYGCITLSQSLAEALARFVAEKSHIKASKDLRKNVEKLLRRNLISEEVKNALLAIHGKDRNDFHHLNSKVQQDYRKLEARAEECLSLVYIVESDLFAYDLNDGLLVPKYRKYWNIRSDGTVVVYVR